ncbi:hypothetical protein PN465_21785 [Nodularia spumigena CS-584]|uniref:hypothetical protein n=1 Tax=Nodularia spumigena TaxID=70799 RepID=UPI0000EA9890|nr:hypothetical protein [Nodularia spumigena]AHJ29932.1 hypothetical protein NSP_36280 [Nodularia spumigena CCY9414]EAW44346.1 hypothetical protein N9414_19127 [Nodularia spumigena CCY9414]MDB9384825.1 hypothetical protein [Nodularia spumigena CS-584]
MAKKYTYKLLSLIRGKGIVLTAAVLTNILTFVLTSFYTDVQNAPKDGIQKLSYEVIKIPVLNSKAEISNENLNLIVINNSAQTPLKSLSQLKFSLYNYSDKDFTNLELNLKLSSKSNKSLNILTEKISNDIKSNIIKNSNEAELSLSNIKNYKYKIKYVNRAERETKERNFKPAFQIVYTIADEELDNINLDPKILASGVSLNEHNSERRNKYLSKYLLANQDYIGYFYEKFLFLFILLFGFFTFILYMWIGYDLWQGIKAEKQYINDIKKQISSKEQEFNQVKNKTIIHLKENAMTAQEVVNLILPIHQTIVNNKLDEYFSQALIEKLNEPGELDEFKHMESLDMAKYLFKILKINKQYILRLIGDKKI